MRGILVVAPALLVACTAASPDPGVEAMLRVQGAQFRPGPFPSDAGGPSAQSLVSRHSEIPIGEVDEPVRAVLDPAARGFVLGIAGYDGAWILPAGPPDVDAPDSATAKASIGLAQDFPPGAFTLQLAASNVDGVFGTATTTQILATTGPEVSGELVIGLTWSSHADLDLHVVDPNGGEAYSGDPNTVPAPAPGEPVDPEAYKAGGILDHDGNADCHFDGAPSEHVVWQRPPPDGHYLVRVDIVDACGDASTTWTVSAKRRLTPDADAVVISSANGISTPDQTQLPHGYGAGDLALQFTCDASGCRP